MNTKNIKALIALLNESDLSAIEVTEGDSTIRLERNVFSNTVIHQGAAPVASPAAQPVATANVAGEAKKDDAIDFNNVNEFRAPIIGVYYSQPSPDAKPFIEVGAKVKKGDVLCIIEAMKVLNEITADRDGEIIDICVQSGQVVEYAQVLFKIH